MFYAPISMQYYTYIFGSNKHIVLAVISRGQKKFLLRHRDTVMP